jgi:hypothetical protein
VHSVGDESWFISGDKTSRAIFFSATSTGPRRSCPSGRLSGGIGREIRVPSAAVGEFFKILGEQAVPEEKVPARLIEVATHFAQTRDALAALALDTRIQPSWPTQRTKHSTTGGWLRRIVCRYAAPRFAGHRPFFRDAEKMGLDQNPRKTTLTLS